MQVGNVKVGSQHPIALQTMTTTDTRNVQATVDQVCLAACLQLCISALQLLGKDVVDV